MISRLHAYTRRTESSVYTLTIMFFFCLRHFTNMIPYDIISGQPEVGNNILIVNVTISFAKCQQSSLFGQVCRNFPRETSFGFLGIFSFDHSKIGRKDAEKFKDRKKRCREIRMKFRKKRYREIRMKFRKKRCREIRMKLTVYTHSLCADYEQS